MRSLYEQRALTKIAKSTVDKAKQNGKKDYDGKADDVL